MQIQLKSAVAAVTLEDLLFENRNKKYGAYEIRVNYEKRLTKALITAVSLFLLLLLLVRFYPQRQETVSMPIPETDTTVVHIDPYIAPTDPPHGMVQHSDAHGRTVPVITPENTDTASTEHPTTTTSTTGNDTATLVDAGTGSGGKGDSKGGNSLDTATQNPPTPEPQIFDLPDVNPEFPGGAVAYEKYLQENVKYPKFADDESIQGNIYISFVVTETGEVTDVQLVRGINREMDNNALEAVRKMPRWTPGKMGKRNVKARCSAQIKVIER